MSSPTDPRDLFGKPIPRRRPRYMAALERYDKATRNERAERILWLSKVVPRNTGYLLPLESSLIFQEARDCFVQGQFVATIVLASSFVEHWLGSIVASRGFEKEATAGLAVILKCCQAHRILPPIIGVRVDTLRKIRNPFVHLKPFDHPYSIRQRSLRIQSDLYTTLEADAKSALETMYSVAVFARNEGPELAR